jgi:hypothetical protein
MTGPGLESGQLAAGEAESGEAEAEKCQRGRRWSRKWARTRKAAAGVSAGREWRTFVMLKLRFQYQIVPEPTVCS